MNVRDKPPWLNHHLTFPRYYLYARVQNDKISSKLEIQNRVINWLIFKFNFLYYKQDKIRTRRAQINIEIIFIHVYISSRFKLVGFYIGFIREF